VPGSFTLYIIAQTKTPILNFIQIQVLVCGLEIVTGTKNPIPSFYKDWNNGIFTLEEDLSTWFSNTEQIHCPIIAYELYVYNT
jgi:hypothetical protein